MPMICIEIFFESAPSPLIRFNGSERKNPADFEAYFSFE
jgi:hypothetical protein